MRLSRRVLFMASFLGLAATAALAVARIGSPSLIPLLLAATLAGAVAGAPGLIRRRAGWAALVLIPLGLYLLWRVQLPAPSFARGQNGQLGFYLDQLGAGTRSYMEEELPFDFGSLPQLRLLLSTGVYIAVALAAVAALSLRRVLPAIVILLVPLGFGLTIDQADRVVWLPLAFLFAAGCLLMLSRSLARRHWRPVDALAGAGTAVVASLMALSLLGTTSVAAGKPWQDWRTWGPITITSNTRLVFNWMENYPRLLDPQANAEVMRVRSSVPSYWRANALDAFNGTSWISVGSFQQRLPSADIGGEVTYTVPLIYPQLSGKVVNEVFTTSSIYTDYFFAGGSPRLLKMGQNVPVFTGSTGSLAVDRHLGPKLQYAVTAIVPQLTPDDLVGRGRAYPQDILPYAALPFPPAPDPGNPQGLQQWRRQMKATPQDREWLGLARLNRSVVGDATDPYQIALLVEDYLRSSYTYSLRPPPTIDESPYAAFLFLSRKGYCQHFAGAMAVLLRFNGVPARVAVGFTSGRHVGGDTYVVSRNDAHAWVEAYFPEIGWVAFDPTPGRSLPGAGPSSTSLGFVDPYTAAGAAGGVALPKLPAADRRDVQHDPTGGSQGFRLTPVPSAGGGRWIPWILALIVAMLAWPAARLVWRQARLRTGDPAGRLRASLELLVLELRDYGIEVPASQTLEETAAVLRERLDLDAAAVVGRVQAVLFGGREATAEDAAAVTSLRRELKRRLRARAGVTSRLAASYGLRAARTAASH